MFDASASVAPTIQYCPHFTESGRVVFDRAAAMGLEGIVSKRVDAPYTQRRSDHWLKIKHRMRQEMIVGGFATSTAREGFRALLVGCHDGDGRLVYCGRVGSGFDDLALSMLADELESRGRKASAFSNPEADPEPATVHWVRPELVVEVEFAGWTGDRLLRHAVYKGLRADMHPADVVLEQIEPAPERPPEDPAPSSPGTSASRTVSGVRITHPTRPVYPEQRVTKVEVAQYFEAVFDRMTPHLDGRPICLVRCPLGLAGESFYQRHRGDGFATSVRASSPDDETDPYMVIDDLEGLVSLVQMGALEVHTWGCREDDLEKPDRMVFDLDPGPGIEWEHVVASARFVADQLETLGLRSFVKTSGGQGLHLVVPLVRRAKWEQARAFAQGFASRIVRLAPRNFVATASRRMREHRIYVDYLRNTRGATTVAPYSTRARPGACVSTPLDWTELSAEVPPSSYDVRTVMKRIGDEDPWRELRKVRQSITAAMLSEVTS